MRKVLIWLCKAMVAGIMSFCIIMGCCYFYYNLPVHYTTDSGATDYSWDPNVIASRGTEGFALTRTDENGYVNTYPNKKESIDILVMGSSHTEGFNVGSKENFTYVLNKKLDEKGMGMYAYNIGVSGHTLDRCFKNLENAIEEFKPSEYVIVETASIERGLDTLKKLNEGILKSLDSKTSGILFYLQKNDFIRLAYAQYANAKDNEEKEIEDTYNEEYIKELRIMLENAGGIAKENGCKLIITYIPGVEFDYYGNVVPLEEEYKENVFRQICEDNGIVFINMHSAFEKMYNETKHLPRGFSNTKAGEGHTNKYGHECIAQELFNYISGGEGK